MVMFAPSSDTDVGVMTPDCGSTGWRPWLIASRSCRFFAVASALTSYSPDATSARRLSVDEGMPGMMPPRALRIWDGAVAGL